MATRKGRQKNKLPPLYYEGYLEKRTFRDKTSRKLWTSLCGNTLFFFNNNKDADYVEKLDLIEFISVNDDRSRDQKLDAARFNLRLKDHSLKLTAPSLEARELWKGYIHSVVELSVPSSLNLLPGQLHVLQEVVEKEQERQKMLPSPPMPSPPMPSPPMPSLPTPSPPITIPKVPARGRRSSSAAEDLPACYMPVSRVEAELLLEREADRGNLLLRPGGHGNTFTVTTRELFNGPLFKHYRVIQKPGEGFSIDLQKPILCATLHDVIALILKETGGTLTPYIMEEHYEDNISCATSNKENGERINQSVSPRNAPLPRNAPPPSNAPPPLPQKPANVTSNENRERTDQSVSPRNASLPNNAPPPLLQKPANVTSNENGERTNQSVSPRNAPLPSNAPPPLLQKPGTSLISDQSCAAYETYLSERAVQKATPAVSQPLPRSSVSFANQSDENGEKMTQFLRPRNSPPPAPPNSAGQKATLVVSPMPRSRTLSNSTLPKHDSQSIHETEEKDDPNKASKPVPVPRRFPQSSPRHLSRSTSHACAISEELKLKFAKIKVYDDH